MTNILFLVEAAAIAVLSTYLVFQPKNKKNKALEKTAAQTTEAVILATAVWAIQADVHIAPITVKIAIAILLIPVAAHALRQMRPQSRPARHKRT